MDRSVQRPRAVHRSPCERPIKKRRGPVQRADRRTKSILIFGSCGGRPTTYGGGGGEINVTGFTRRQRLLCACVRSVSRPQLIPIQREAPVSRPVSRLTGRSSVDVSAPPPSSSVSRRNEAERQVSLHGTLSILVPSSIVRRIRLHIPPPGASISAFYVPGF